MHNPSIAKRGTGEDLQLGVVGVSRTIGFRGRESRKEITCSDPISMGMHMDSFLNDLASHDMSGQALTGKAMGYFGAPIRTRCGKFKQCHARGSSSRRSSFSTAFKRWLQARGA